MVLIMNKQCPSCQSTEIYCRHFHSLELCCDTCHYRWQAKQILAPIFRDTALPYVMRQYGSVKAEIVVN